MEHWLIIPGTNGLYSASDNGRVRSEPVVGTTGRQRGRILRPAKDTKGYPFFVVHRLDGSHVAIKVHRAVALAFIGPCPDGLQVNHKDGDKSNNRPSNLEYVTCEENIRHCWVNGMHGIDHCQGEANYNAKLTAEKVREIRALYPAQSLGQLAARFGVTKSNVSQVVRRKTWAHV